MKFWSITAATLLLLLATFGLSKYLFAPDTSDAPVDMRHMSDVSMVMQKSGFVPPNVRITKGTRITFTSAVPDKFWPASDPHPEHSIDPVFDSKEPIEASSSWSFVFDRIGSWGYHDHLHSYLSGTIYVEE